MQRKVEIKLTDRKVEKAQPNKMADRLGESNDVLNQSLKNNFYFGCYLRFHKVLACQPGLSFRRIWLAFENLLVLNALEIMSLPILTRNSVH